MATVVVGDSHVFWLHRFRRENDLPGIIEDNGNGPIKCIGVRGGTVRSLSSPGVIETIAKNYRPLSLSSMLEATISTMLAVSPLKEWGCRFTS